MSEQMNAAFAESLKQGYTFQGPLLLLGAAKLNGQIYTDTPVGIPMRTLNRHGLIAGATGTGKTKTLQVLAEGLSEQGIPVMLMDIKGDLSGLAARGSDSPRVEERNASLGIDFNPRSFPVELLTLSQQKGVRLRATVSEFGPVMLSKMLGLNETQQGFVAMLFKFCDDRQLPLLDLRDLKRVLQYITDTGKSEIEAEYGKISTTSLGTVLRKVIELEQQGADLFFGEMSFDIDDLIRTSASGEGIISILRVVDLQDRPKLFSTFMLCLLAELYNSLPERGDADKPVFVMIIDEAHLLFQEATDSLVEQIETVIKLIRSKGVGIFFCTQNPADLPAPVLGQLGLRVQHALRAITAIDRKNIKLAAQNFPITTFFKTDEAITQLGTGEALVTALNEKGVPTPLVPVMMQAPRSRMDVLTPDEISELVETSPLVDKYAREIDRESAYELLSGKMEAAQQQQQAEEQAKTAAKAARAEKAQPQEKSMWEEMMGSTMARQVGRDLGRAAGNVLVRGILGAFGVKSTTTRRKTGWF